MDVKYIGGDAPWTLPFGDHFYSSSQPSFNDTTQKNRIISTSDLETIARRYDFEPLYSTNETQSKTKNRISNNNLHWMNAGVLFTDKKIDPDLIETHKTDFHDDHGHTFCYLCSINQHEHEHTKPRAQSQRRKLIPYNNPKALKARSSSIDRTNQDTSLSNLTSYRFIVRTGTGLDSGTRAQVFLYMYGTENDWTSINLCARKNSNSYGFPSGSIRTFCFKGPDIGQLRHLNVNLIGARSDKEWFLKEIEITNLDTSVTWLCEFNCWLPNKDKQESYQIKPSIGREKELSLENLSVYVLQIRTGGKPFAGTDSAIDVVIRGSTSQTRRLPLTTNQANLFEQNQLDTFAIVGWDLGDLSEITVESDKTQFAADWDLKEMIMWKIIPSDDHKQLQVYFPFNAWIGKDISKLKAKKEAYPSTDHHPRGPTCYYIAVKTGKGMNAGTDANVFIVIYGKSGRTIIHHLDNPGKNDFERNTTSEFTIMDIDVGKIDRIKIWHDNSGVGPAWLLDSVIIRKKHSTCRPITNVFIQRLEQISKALYRQAREQLTKNHKIRLSSTKENEQQSINQRNPKLKDLDDITSSRGILRSPIIYDKTNLQKKVTWDEQSLGSQDEPFSINTQRMKTMQTKIEQKRKQDNSSIQIETGHFDHQAYWISSHTYNDNKWQIKSIEEKNPFDLDQSTRSLLLSDRLTISSKIKTSINEKDDDVYEFQADRWLDKDKNDGKLEVYLTPKSIQLSTHTINEAKPKSSSSSSDIINDSKKKPLPPSSSSSSATTKTSSDFRHDKYDDEHSKSSSKYDLGPLERSPRNLASLDRSSHDTLKTQFDDSRSSQRPHQKLSNTLKQQEESFIDKYHRSSSPDQRSKSPRNDHNLSTSQQQLLARISGEPPYQSRSAATSLVDTRSSLLSDQRSKPPRHDNDLNIPLNSERELSSRLSGDSSYHRRPTATSLIDTRSSPVSNQRAKSPRNDNDFNNLLTSERELLARISGEPPYHHRSAATSLVDTRSSLLSNQRSQSPRLNNELISPLTSNRDLSIKKSTEPSFRPKSAARSTLEPSSHRTTRNQIYSSAYGTAPTDDF